MVRKRQIRQQGDAAHQSASDPIRQVSEASLFDNKTFLLPTMSGLITLVAAEARYPCPDIDRLASRELVSGGWEDRSY
jgi:hypothetical protein